MARGNGAVATRPQGNEDTALTVIAMVDKRADQFRHLLGSDERAYERFRDLAIHMVTSNPELLKCEPASIVEAIRASAAMGLELNGLMGEGYVIPYKGRATFQVGWRGLLRLARRSGDIAAIDAQCVYEHDDFDIDLGSEPRITHKPSLSDRGNRVGAYAYARLASGELVTEWMPNADIEMVRRSSRAKDSGPWISWPDEMARKTVLKRICKRLPLDSLAQQALELEARADSVADEPSRPARRNGARGPSAPVARVQERLGITSGSVEPSRSEDGPEQAEEAGVGQPSAAELPPVDHEGDPEDRSSVGTGPEASGSPDHADAAPGAVDGTSADQVASAPTDEAAPPDPSASVDDASPAEPTGDSSVASGTCGAIAPEPDPLGLREGGPCAKTGPCVRGVHQNEAGHTWAVEKKG